MTGTASLRSLVTASVALLVVGGCRSASPSPPSAAAPRASDGMVTFTYAPPPAAPAITAIVVAGTFNEWSTAALPMQRQMDGSWQVTARVADGEHQYKFRINGVWPADMCDDRDWGDPQGGYRVDPDADRCAPDGQGGQNAVLSVGSDIEAHGLGFAHDPETAAYVSIADGTLSVRFRAHRGQVRSASVIADSVRIEMHRQLTYRHHEVWRAPLLEGTADYRFTLQTADGEREFGPYAVPVDLFRDVAWVGAAVGYQIFPERFWNGDPTNDAQTVATSSYHYKLPAHWGASQPPLFTAGWGGEVTDSHCCHQYFGGDLQGILDRLDHLVSLGVTLLYLNPIFLAGSAHGYDTFDFLEIAPNFGDERLLRRLLDEARARGVRVMWDFVPNHVGVGHWAFQHAVEHGEASPYWSWFRFHVPAAEIEVGNGRHYEAWWGLGSLPKLETRNPEVFAHLMHVTRRWTEFGFDGIRVDVPNEIVNRKEFFRAFREAAKAVNPEAYLVGEVWQRSPSWLEGDEFDALMNYAIGQAVLEPFALGEMSGAAAAQEMAQLYAEYPEASVAMQFNLISSHDTARLLTKLGGGALGAVPDEAALARHRLASAMLYALPGVPVTFQGDECAFLGAGEGPQEENRYPMQWDRCDAEMLDHYRQIAGLKRTIPALRTSVIRDIRGDDALLSFFRGEPGRDELLAVFSSSPDVHGFELPAGRWRDAATAAEFSGSVPIEARGWRYLVRAGR
jgi:cyclomaltodextrinase / maltogenic alpha-amylase / neopullulanase